LTWTIRLAWSEPFPIRICSQTDWRKAAIVNTKKPSSVFSFFVGKFDVYLFHIATDTPINPRRVPELLTVIWQYFLLKNDGRFFELPIFGQGAVAAFYLEQLLLVTCYV